MTTIEQSYKINYGNSFINSANIFFMAFFIGLWLFFFVHPWLAVGLMALAVLYIMYWHLRREGTFLLTLNGEEQHISTSGKIPLNHRIKKMYWGWDYAYINSEKALSRSMPVFGFGTFGNNSGSKSIQNTDQKILLLQLENDEYVALLQECLPWEDVKDLNHIGTFLQRIEVQHKMYLTGNFYRFQKKVKGLA